jgi:threonine aldolase
MAINRRNFLKASGLSVLPAVIPFTSANATSGEKQKWTAEDLPVKFQGDGEMFTPAAYLNILQQANSKASIERDSYGKGGAVEALEKKFVEITGKEKAVFMPTGTMANQFAIDVLSGENTKVFVQETSHVFRDEADAAQSVFGKRLIPLGKEQAYFTADELKESVEYHNRGEVFKSGMGAVSIENPVRRANGRMIPLDELKKISTYCRSTNLKLHLDGARLYMASVWSGVSIKEYASLFDTVYISLYKYFGAAAGAVLCGDKAVIDKMEHLIKIHGGTMFSNWANAAMALNRLDGFEDRLKQAIKRSEEVFAGINQLTGIRIEPLKDGTNIYQVIIIDIDGRKLSQALAKEHGIIGLSSYITVNETLLYKEPKIIINAVKEALKTAKA